MKKMKKMFSFVLALALMLSVNASYAFAAEPEDPATEPVEHTIEIFVEPYENVGIRPYIWDQRNVGMPSGTTATTPSFTVPERYMAFEASATDVNGNGPGVSYTVNLYSNSVFKAGGNFTATGNFEKIDWIDLEASNTSCYFKVSNYSGVGLIVTIKYYSWR